MKHLFIPYELAVIAKEKGFDEPCLGWYFKKLDNKEFILCLGEAHKSNLKNTAILSPLYQQIIDWFREKHKISVEPYSLLKTAKTFHTIYRIQKLVYKGYRDFNYKTLNKAIEEAFKLI